MFLSVILFFVFFVSLLKRHEPDNVLREKNLLSFEGFARYLMDKDNYAFVSETITPEQDVRC